MKKNGLILIAIVIILFYWSIDIITKGALVSRLLITFSILAYGIITQFLLNKQKTLIDSLQQARDALEGAYTWMRDNRDELRQQMHEEDIAFLVDQDGKIEGVTERTLAVTNKSRDSLVGTYLTQLMQENDCEDCRRELRLAWKGMTQQLKGKIVMPGIGKQEFGMKFTRLTVSGKRLLLVILNFWPGRQHSSKP